MGLRVTWGCMPVPACGSSNVERFPQIRKSKVTASSLLPRRLSDFDSASLPLHGLQIQPGSRGLTRVLDQGSSESITLVWRGSSQVRKHRLGSLWQCDAPKKTFPRGYSGLERRNCVSIG